jgi:membrane-bound metal-dependent hydrolase YbcI (DUF457 family)
MPQNGFHGLVGLATAKALVPRVAPAVRTPFAFGLVFGAMLPDIDLYPTAVAVVAGVPDAVKIFHRSATHSVLFLLLLVAAAVITKKRISTSWLFWGLALGVLGHEVLDIFFWFAQLDIMWPFSHWPASNPPFQVINIWTSDYKGLVSNIRDAFEFVAFALFLYSLRKIVLRIRPAAKVAIDLLVMRLMCAYFVVALTTAFLFAGHTETQQKIVNFPFLLLFLPYCWWRAWVYREEIAQWAMMPLGSLQKGVGEISG